MGAGSTRGPGLPADGLPPRRVWRWPLSAVSRRHVGQRDLRGRALSLRHREEHRRPRARADRWNTRHHDRLQLCLQPLLRLRCALGLPAGAARELAHGARARRRDDVSVSKTALISGASGGIGYELALLFARDRFDCILVARSHDRLEALAARMESEFRVKTLVLPKDLSKPAAVEEIFRDVSAAPMQVDVLVNNAGFPVYGLFAETELRVELEMLQVNVIALTVLTKLFLKGMIERRYGRILNPASPAAFEPGPPLALYYASKGYVLSFSEALANEVRGTGVTVTTLAPGPTRTGFQKRGQLEDSRLVQGEIADAASVALAGYRGLMAGKTLVIPGFSNKLIPWIVRVSPRGVVTRVVRRMQERVPH